MTVKNAKEFACTSWTIDDVHSYRRDNGMSQWDDDSAEYWLSQNEDTITELMIDRGWEVFSCIEER